MQVIRLALALALSLLPGAALAQALTTLPMPQSYRQDELRVQWETDSNPPGTAHALDWGPSSPTQNSVGATETIAVAADRFVHRAIATGLAAGTSYAYRVRSGPTTSATYVARTAGPPDAPFRMAFIADNQNSAGMSFATLLQELALHAPDVIGHAGDTVQNGDVLAEWPVQWFGPLASAANLGQRVPVLVARGNHDGFFPPAQAYHWLPGNNRWYAETIGRVRFLFLDSNLISAQQDAFVAAELAAPAAQDADFRIVVFHHPGYTNLWDQPGYNGHPHPRDVWVPMFEAGNVDLVINGHAHAYERAVRNGIVYSIVGGAGGLLDRVPATNPWSFFVVAESVHHFAILDFAPGHLSFTAYTAEGATLDHFELGGPVPEIPVFPAVSPGR
jgi:predicted phosphodiesterase